MGCDAHPIIEVLKDGIWTAAQSERFQDYDECPSPCRVLGQRNYHRFSILADVRNHYREHRVDPLFADRGLPVDASDQVRDELADDGDIHSVTYFTLRELMDTDWNADATQFFEVHAFGDAYQYFLEHQRLPKDWTDDWGGQRDFVSEGEMALLLMSGNGMPTWGPSTHEGWEDKVVKSGPVVTIKTPITYYQIDPVLRDTVIPELQKLGEPDRVRVVIGFDN